MLHVPVGTTELYAQHWAWKKFTNIVDDTDNPAPRGDLTGDGVVDVDDLNLVINMMVHKAEETEAADLNGDGAVDVDDLNIIINIMVHKE